MSIHRPANAGARRLAGSAAVMHLGGREFRGRCEPAGCDDDRCFEGSEEAPRGWLHHPQAEAVIATVQEAAEGAEFATKGDLEAAIAALHSALREVELRLEARLEAIKSEILNRVFGLILGALVVNIVAMLGARSDFARGNGVATEQHAVPGT